MNQEQASEEISKLLDKARAALNKAAKLAENHSLEFSWYIPDAWGFGGNYISKGFALKEAQENADVDEEVTMEDIDSNDCGWRSSSSQC